MKTGKITKLLGGFYYIADEEGNIYESRAKGNFRHKSLTPMVGDWVEFTEGQGNTLAYIQKLLPRSSQMKRPAVANVDQVFLVVPVDEPKYNLDLINKLLVYYEKEKIPIVILINKVDLNVEEGEYLKRNFALTGYPVYALSFTTPSDLERLRPLLAHKTTALAGVSAAGKSTLTDYFVEEDVKVGGLSKKTMRGKHTTRHNELFEGKDGIFLLDTPGFSSIEMAELKSRELKRYFPEFRKAGPCRFLDCDHRKEPGCEVKSLVDEGKIWDKRYEGYLSLFEELKEREKREW